MTTTFTIARRELRSYFATPVASVFIVIFLVVTGIFTFELSGFLDGDEASLRTFFEYHPWLYLFLIPAVAMRLWSEERKSGTVELLLTLPVRMGDAVLGKFLAAWAFTGIALALTFPMWLTVNYLGDPDNGVILASYLGSFLMAGAYLAIGSCISAFTKNQVIAFIVSVVLCFLFVLSGHDVVVGFFKSWAPAIVTDAVASFSFLTHFDAISKGVLDLRDVVFFLSVIAFFLFVNAVVIDLKKAD